MRGSQSTRLPLAICDPSVTAVAHQCPSVAASLRRGPDEPCLRRHVKKRKRSIHRLRDEEWAPPYGNHPEGLQDAPTMTQPAVPNTARSAAMPAGINRILKEDVEKYRNELIEKIAETDEVLMDKFFDDQELSVEELKVSLRKAVINLEIFPVLCGSALRHRGVHPLLDAVIDYLPSTINDT